MISRLKGTLISREPDHVEVETAGGVVYEIKIPLSILQRLPKPPAPDFEIRTLQLVREDSVTLYGFIEPFERELFVRLLGAPKVGPKVALAMLSTYSAGRLAKALAEKLGGEFKQTYLTLGSYDLVAVVELPDDAAAATFALTTGAHGNIRTTTLKAFTEAEYRDIIAALP